MPLPAQKLLHPACPVKPAWAVFDAAWYLATYPDARAVCAGQPRDAALVYYLRVGARLGHSPSPLFDELFYLARNPDIAALIRAGNYASGFDHFCQHGHRGVSPHWLFDDALYADLHDDMSLENLDIHHCHGRYDHYLKSGQRERRMAHFLFDSAYYQARAGAGAEEAGPFVHYLYQSPERELAPSIYFDPAWYLEHHPAVRAEIARGRFSSGLHHYLCNESPEYFDPVPEFSENFYRRRHPDIAAAIEAGFFRNAYQQFVHYGAFELRQPSPEIDLAYYRDMHERVRADISSGAVRDAFAHLRAIGIPENLPHAPPDRKPVLDERATRDIFLQKARAALPVFARNRIDFSHQGRPEISVIMAAFNRFELTLHALASLRQNFAGAIQLILVDNASNDETRFLEDYVAGATILRNTENAGFLLACNQALAHAAAPVVLYMNNDVELGFGAVAAALGRLQSHARIGAVGGKIIRSNGLLQEAGSILWRDGTASGYLRDESPLAPEANFAREVDFCSGVFLACRTELVKLLGGFDADYAPAYFEDADLCARMIEAGYRIIYDPALFLHHLEFGSASTSEASMALMRRGRKIFRRKQNKFLEGQHEPGEKNILLARGRSLAPRLLFIEDTVPLRHLGSGFVRSNDIVRAIAQAGFEVHVFPLNGAPHAIPRMLGDFPDGVEILHNRDYLGLPAFLAERANFYDVFWVARTHNFHRVLPYLKKTVKHFKKRPVILDTEAVAALRDAARAGKADYAQALAKEFSGTEICAKILAVNPREAEILRGLGLKQTEILGTARAPMPGAAPFSARAGLLFAGAIHQADSPNLDALEFYAENILPALEAMFSPPPVLHVAGYQAPDIDLSSIARHGHILCHGLVSDLAPLYNAAKIFIAPTRFAAGTPYKCYEAAAMGLPIVASSLLAEQLGWRDGVELLAAPADDAALFARQIARLYHDETLWQTLRRQALERLAAEHGFADFNARVAEVLSMASVLGRERFF